MTKKKNTEINDHITPRLNTASVLLMTGRGINQRGSTSWYFPIDDLPQTTLFDKLYCTESVMSSK